MTYRCVQCGHTGPWGPGWRYFCGVLPHDGVVCSDACEDALFARWDRDLDEPAPYPNCRQEEP
jgi:hypothetical protein